MTCENPTIQERLNNDPWGLMCNPLFSLSESTDSNLQELYVTEHLKMGASNINVFKLLGIHEQNRTTIGNGYGNSISSGEVSSLPSSDVFTVTPCTGWKSTQKGNAVLTNSFIGYDYGPLIAAGRTIYGVETENTYMVTEVTIQQAALSQNRATKVRLERSQNGRDWFGVSILTLTDDDQSHTYNVKPSVKSRYWRIRPTAFNGGATDSWHVMKLAFANNEQTQFGGLQDQYGFIESRDRDYNTEALQVKMYYELVDVRSELSKMGISTTNFPFTFITAFVDTIRILGRPIVIGDILEVPNETQYTTTLQPVKKYLEVTDVSWATEGYTPGWRPTLQKIVAHPIFASQETMDLVNGFRKDKDAIGFAQNGDEQYQNVDEISDRIFQQAKENTPERGADSFFVAEIPKDENAPPSKSISAKTNLPKKGVYIEDGLPPNAEPYTEGDTFPTRPSDKAYHRLTYSSVNNNIPPRLFRFSAIKNKWIFCEADRRFEFNKTKPTLQNQTISSGSIANDKVGKS